MIKCLLFKWWVIILYLFICRRYTAAIIYDKIKKYTENTKPTVSEQDMLTTILRVFIHIFVWFVLVSVDYLRVVFFLKVWNQYS